MANILNCYAIFFKKLETFESRRLENAFGSRSLKLQSIDELLESTKFEKVKRSNIVKCVQKNYFSYIIDEFLFV